MPHIFPRRFLRTRDVLDPSDFNDDIHPVYDLINGRLDRTNFNAGNLKKNLRNHPDSIDSDGLPVGACVAEGAYFNTHVSQVESRYEFYATSGTESPRHPPNFVKQDGSTFRDTMDFTGANPKAYPSIVPNHGAWSAVKNADLSDSQKLTFTTGQSKIWISAYAQYIWQGFFETKNPWINGSRRFGGNEDFDPPAYEDSWLRHHGRDNLTKNERLVLNSTGPSDAWESLPSATTSNTDDNLEVFDAPYAFPLNETEGTEDEREMPNRNGYHHISKGFKPCMLQFALRIDGKIIEETITGKRLPFEESVHGLEVTDSIRMKEEDEVEREELREFFPDFTEDGYVFGQRSFSASSAYGDSKDSRPGQKLRSSRAVSYGPEIMPVRLGAVVEVQPGEHTIELVVRRLQRKKGKFDAGDFVGVFSRRLLAFDLPIKPTRQEKVPEPDPTSTTDWSSPSGFRIPGFKTEDPINDSNLSDVRETLKSKLNAITPDQIDFGVLSNSYLPSKVRYSRTDTISPTLEIGTYTGEYGSNNFNESSTEAIFPGFRNPTYLDNVVSLKSSGWSSGGDYFSSSRAGWLQLKDTSTATLHINAPAGETVLRPNEQIILMMDVEVRGIEPIYSDDADYVKNYIHSHTDGLKTRELWRDYGNYLLAERYLDLFALFAIGYRQDGDWVIGSSDSVPAMVNSFNWVNRSVMFSAENTRSLPTKLSTLAHKDVWDMDSGWDKMETPADAFFSTEEVADDAWLYPGHTYARGGRLFRSNLGVNIPIMQVIENTGTTDLNITAFGGFASTMAPSKWTKGFGPSAPREWEPELPLPAGGGYSFITNIERAWASPVGGRDILKGARVHFGNSRLTAIKIVK